MDNNQRYHLAEWLSGDMSTKEVQQYITPEEFEDYNLILKYLDGVKLPPADVEASYKALQEKIQSRKKTKMFRLLSYASAAVIAVILGLGFFFTRTVSVSTRTGETREVALHDGTRVFLNAKSTIKYSRNPFAGRNIELNGEAYFEVTKGDKFTVTTPRGNVSVLGTRFDVTARDNYFKVVCYEGKVRVSNSSGHTVLTPGNFVTGEILKPEKQTEANQKAGWLSGKKYFENAPIDAVFEDLQNRFGYKVVYPDELNNKKYTGSISYTDLTYSVKRLSLLLQMKYRIDERNKTVFLEK